MKEAVQSDKGKPHRGDPVQAGEGGSPEKSMKANLLEPRRERLQRASPQESYGTSDRMAAKCAIFDATNPSAAFAENARAKMKLFEANNHRYDLQKEK